MSDLIGQLTAVGSGCLVLFVMSVLLAFAGIVREWVVIGPAYRRMVDERNYWRDIAVPSLKISSQLVQAVKEDA